MRLMLRIGAVAALAFGVSLGLAQAGPAVEQGDYVAHDFHFRSGESLQEMKLHYRTLGAPHRDAQGHVDNAVLILHGTGGAGAQFLAPYFAGVLFGPGQLLDAAKYYIVLPDGLGHGKSTKPSDGLRAKFPKYDYDDMVDPQYGLVKEGLGIRHLRLVIGNSMGGMHAWIWGERYPRMMDALVPMASQPTEMAARNWMLRRMMIETIRNDPDYKGGHYTAPPRMMKYALSAYRIASAGGTLAATKDALEHGFGGTLSGGTHHAFRAEGSGFCVFNDVAIAIYWLRARGHVRRAAIVDLDVHQGDGTAHFFEHDPDVLIGAGVNLTQVLRRIIRCPHDVRNQRDHDLVRILFRGGTPKQELA